MPTYDYECQKCGVFELTHSMKVPPVKKCPTCHAKIQRLISTSAAFHPPKDSGWENENGGRGRYIAQLGDPDDPGCYARSRNQIPDMAKRKGFQSIEKC